MAAIGRVFAGTLTLAASGFFRQDLSAVAVCRLKSHLLADCSGEFAQVDTAKRDKIWVCIGQGAGLKGY